MRNWKKSVKLGDLFEAYDEDAFAVTRDAVVARLAEEKLDRFDREDLLTTSEDLIEEMRFSENEDEFNEALDNLYDWGDEVGVWIQTFA